MCAIFENLAIAKEMGRKNQTSHEYFRFPITSKEELSQLEKDVGENEGYFVCNHICFLVSTIT